MWCSTVGAIVTLTLSILAVPLVTDPQPVGKVYRIGYLLAGPGGVSEDFLHGLRELGYVEGQNIVIEYRAAAGKLDRLPALAAELVRLPVDILLTPGTPATLAAKAATSAIPIVFAVAVNPVGSGLIASWAHPGGTSRAQRAPGWSR
jgi:putative ABC transport system substrate-binding protein